MSVPAFLQFTPVESFRLILDRLEIFSGYLGLSPSVVFWILVGWLAIMGMAGLHLARLYVSVGAASWVFYVCAVNFESWAAGREALAAWPPIMSLVVALVLAAITFFFAWKLSLPTVYVIFAVIGFYVSTFLVTNLWVCVSVGVLFSISVAFAFPFLFITLSSVVAGFGVTALLGAIYPAKAALQLGTNTNAIWVGVGISAAFMLFQCITTKLYKKVGL